MKIIHTYVPTRNGLEINKSLLQNMIYSVLCAKNHYDTIELYTTKEIADIIIKIGIPYDNIITEGFENFNSLTFSIPKLITYSKQTEDFIHIDIDTFLLEKINIDKEIPYFYAHPDIDMTTLKNLKMGINMSETYIKNTSLIAHLIPENLQEFIDFTDIPNMNIFGTYNPKIVAEASKYCLDFYEQNRDFFDSDYYNACIIEQLLVPATIKMLNEDYYKNYYLMESKDVFKVNQDTNNLEIATYPLSMSFNGITKHLLNEFDTYLLVNYDFHTNVHLSGFKNLDIFQFMIRETIIDKFNRADLLKKLDDLFKNKIPGQDICDRYYEHISHILYKRMTMFKTKKDLL